MATATVPIGQILLGNVLEWSHVSVVLLVSAVLNGMVSLFVRWNVLRDQKVDYVIENKMECE